MALAIDPERPGADVADVAEPLASLLEQGLVQDAEIVLAFLALWLLERVEAGRMSREAADAVFTAIDARLTAPGGSSLLSPEAQELLFEAEFLHHLGEPDGPAPDRLRELALTILRRSGHTAT